MKSENKQRIMTELHRSYHKEMFRQNPSIRSLRAIRKEGGYEEAMARAQDLGWEGIKELMSKEQEYPNAEDFRWLGISETFQSVEEMKVEKVADPDIREALHMRLRLERQSAGIKAMCVFFGELQGTGPNIDRLYERWRAISIAQWIRDQAGELGMEHERQWGDAWADSLDILESYCFEGALTQERKKTISAAEGVSRK